MSDPSLNFKLHETNLLDDNLSTSDERQALDEAFDEFERDANFGQPWRDVFRELRRRI